MGLSGTNQADARRTLRQNWLKLLADQKTERFTLAEKHEEQREAYYRANKATIDTFTWEELNEGL